MCAPRRLFLGPTQLAERRPRVVTIWRRWTLAWATGRRCVVPANLYARCIVGASPPPAEDGTSSDQLASTPEPAQTRRHCNTGLGQPVQRVRGLHPHVARPQEVRRHATGALSSCRFKPAYQESDVDAQFARWLQDRGLPPQQVNGMRSCMGSDLACVPSLISLTLLSRSCCGTFQGKAGALWRGQRCARASHCSKSPARSPLTLTGH